MTNTSTEWEIYTTIKCCLKTVNINLEPEGYSLVWTIHNAFSCQKFSCKTPLDYLNMCLRLAADDHICVKRPSSFPTFDFKSVYVPGFNMSDKFLYQIAVPLSTETDQMMCGLCQKKFLIYLCTKLQFKSLMKNKKTSWILVTHLQFTSTP